MYTPLISVCIPAFRADRYLEAALRSVADQTYAHWEVIVTEDGSKDRAEEIVHAFGHTVQQTVVYNRHDVNRGLPATRNTGIAAARGQWVAFLDADDLWAPDHLEALVAASQGEWCDLAFSGSILHDDATWKMIEVREPTVDDLQDLSVALYSGKLSIMPSSVMIRRDAFSHFGPISAEFPICNDTEYWLRLLSRGGRLRYSGKNTCIYRQHSASMSRKAAAILLESARLCEKYSDWEAIPAVLRKARPASLYRWAGRTLLLAEEPDEARDVLQKSLRLAPLNPKTMGLWTRAYFGKKARARPARAT
jgi:glycosyltransferase involved in cell wall biosynthesis